MSFDSVPEQVEAKGLLAAALAQGPAHAYLFQGPPGVGKRGAALAFASELLGGDPRVERRTHPDLYVLEPLGDQIRIDAIRELRHDLHMRPFEADRRVYLIFGAHAMNAVEVWKAAKHGFDVWPDILRWAQEGTPHHRIDEADLQRMKWYGLFWRKHDRLYLALTLSVCVIIAAGALLTGGGH